MSTESVIPSQPSHPHPTHLILTHFSSCPQSFPTSGSFPKSWLFASGCQSIQLQLQSFQWIFRSISFRIDWFDLLAVHGTLKSLSTTIWNHQSFGIQPSLWSNSHLHPTTGKTVALTIWTFISKVMSLPFDMLYRSVTVYLPRSKCLLISWLQSSSSVILEPKEIKSVSFHFFPFYLPQSDGTGCHDLSFLNLLCFNFLKQAFIQKIPISSSIISETLWERYECTFNTGPQCYRDRVKVATKDPSPCSTHRLKKRQKSKGHLRGLVQVHNQVPTVTSGGILTGRSGACFRISREK